MERCIKNDVTDRFDELHDDMESGFLKLRKNVEEMDTDELRRDIHNLMMIGHSQMDTIRRQRREIDGMNEDLMRLHGERARVVHETMILLADMGIAFDGEDDCPSKWIRMAASVVRGRQCESGTETVTDLDRRESMTEVAIVVILGVFVLCAVVWTAMMVAAWA